MKQQGFTLIELMIVVAILGLLAGISLSYYRNYVAKSQVASALTELHTAKMQYENSMNEGEPDTFFDTSNPKFNITSNVCNFTIHQPVAGISNPAIECELKNVSTTILGESLILSRSISGEWSCSTSNNFNSNYKPETCI